MSRAGWIILTLTLALAAACVLRLLVGDGSLAWPSGDILSLRMHRVGVGIAVGALLALAGVLLQASLRNPLASPDILGVGSGASLAVMINIYLGARGVLGADLAANAAWQTVPAALGAFAVIVVLLTLGRSGGRLQPVTLLLTGVVVSILCGAGVMFLQYLMPDIGASTARLLMGTISDDTHGGGGLLDSIAACALVALSMFLAPRLDALCLSDDEAASIGVDVKQTLMFSLGIAGVASALAVALAGPIGFVGLIGPHIARLVLGPRDHRHAVLIPASALTGATVIVLSDTLVKAINLGAGRMPIGVLTALLGGPLLILLLRRHARMGGGNV